MIAFQGILYLGTNHCAVNVSDCWVVDLFFLFGCPNAQVLLFLVGVEFLLCDPLGDLIIVLW